MNDIVSKPKKATAALRRVLQKERLQEQAIRRTPEQLEIAHQPVSRGGASIGRMEFAPSFGAMGEGSKAPLKGVKEVMTKPERKVASKNEAMLDAYYGSFPNLESRAMISEFGTSIMEVVIGTDERVEITATDQYPWRCICSLRIKAADGRNFIGTGWLISPRVLLTAGHCVYMHDAGGWADEIEVIPGRHGGTEPFGSAICTQMSTTHGWVNDQGTNSDYGVIMLPEDKRFGDDLGWIGYANRATSDLEDKIVNLSGYPGDKPAGTQWFDNKQLISVTNEKLFYEIDTFGGQSGAPVWQFMPDGTRYGVGIHTSGHLSGNSATRINDAVFNNIVNWIGQAP